MKTPTAGIDVASTSAYCCLLSPEGQKLHEGKFAATAEDAARLLALLPPQTAVFLESTGRYHLFWARLLAAAGHTVYVLNPLLAKRLQGPGQVLRRHKTDPIDAHSLAQIGRLHGDELRTSIWREDVTNDAVRALCRARVSQRRQLTNTLKRAADLLGRMLPEATMIKLNKNLGWTTLFLAITSLAKLRSLRQSTLEGHIGGHAEELHGLLRGPLNAGAVFDPLLPALQAELRLCQAHRDEQERLERDIIEAVIAAGRAEDVRLARTVPAIGPLTAPILVAALPRDLHLFGSKRQAESKALAFLGCDPRVRESGKWKGGSHMTKRGDRMARTALFQSASCALKHVPELKAYYDRKREEGKSHAVAISHVMRRQLRRLVAVLYDRKAFIHLTQEELPQPSN
jgi:transposase